MDFVHARLTDHRWFRVLTVIDQFTRECLLLYADVSMSGAKVAAVLAPIVRKRGAPQSITETSTKRGLNDWMPADRVRKLLS